jgi:CRP-like cAMP-binding protein
MIETLFIEFPDVLIPQGLSLSKGDKLFKQGDLVTNIYFIKIGKIKLIRNTCEGSPVIVHTGEQGESIAEASLFSDFYHCSAIADSVSTVLSVKKSILLTVMQENPKVMMELLAIFSHQVRDLRTINEIKNIRSASERILSYIKTNINENQEFKLNLSLKDIAHKIGLAHETFYRELKNLENLGKIKRYSDRIKLI